MELKRANGRHDREEDSVRVKRALNELLQADLTIKYGRYFSQHPVLPRTLDLWINQDKYNLWIEEHITAFGRCI